MDSSAWDRLSPEPVDDLIAATKGTALPRLSPALAGSALGGDDRRQRLGRRRSGGGRLRRRAAGGRSRRDRSLSPLAGRLRRRGRRETGGRVRPWAQARARAPPARGHRCPRRSTGRRPRRRGRTPDPPRAAGGPGRELVSVRAEDRGQRVEQPVDEPRGIEFAALDLLKVLGGTRARRRGRRRPPGAVPRRAP